MSEHAMVLEPLVTSPAAREGAEELAQACGELVGMLVALRQAAIRMDAGAVIEATDRMDRQLQALERWGRGRPEHELRDHARKVAPEHERLRVEAIMDQEIIADLLAYVELRNRQGADDHRGLYDPRGAWRPTSPRHGELDEEA